uniref:Reverse transcriptase domain-containing protein n=1 Tax=Gopherus agassizii TaxID=38772 RepID=A0A452IYI5_9SAUR
MGNGLSLPRISDSQKDLLDAPVEITELTPAIKEMKVRKTPGADSFLTEFSEKFSETLTCRLLDMFHEAKNEQTHPPTLREAVISVIPKPGKNLALGSKYRPISLINCDKILAKALAM